MTPNRCYTKCFGVLSALTLWLLAGPAAAQERQTLVNQKYGFQVNYPAAWKAERVIHPDPFPKIEDFKAGSAKVSGGIQIGSDAPEPEDWNAAYFNQGQLRAMDVPPALPTILVYAHPAADLSFDEFTAYFKDFVGLFRMEVVTAGKVKATGGAVGYEYVYKMGSVTTRVAVFFANGKRYGMMYSEPEQKDFDRFEQFFHDLVASFRVLETASGGQKAKPLSQASSWDRWRPPSGCT
jgi:hypothetical protein